MPGSKSNPESAAPELALSVAPRWAWAITAGWKPIENRSWPIPAKLTRQLPLRVAIHASQSQRKLTEEVVEFLQGLPTEAKTILTDDDADLFRPGCIVGTVDVVGCVQWDFDPAELTASIQQALGDAYDAWQRPHVSRSPPLDPVVWACESNYPSLPSYCFLLANARRFAQPIPAKGKLNFWRLDDDQRQAVERQVALQT